MSVHWHCAVLKAREGAGLDQFPVAMARGKHLFPFRTEPLSPSAPMVLGPQGPGRVGRRRFLLEAGPGKPPGPPSKPARLARLPSRWSPRATTPRWTIGSDARPD